MIKRHTKNKEEKKERTGEVGELAEKTGLGLEEGHIIECGESKKIIVEGW